MRKGPVPHRDLLSRPPRLRPPAGLLRSPGTCRRRASPPVLNVEHVHIYDKSSPRGVTRQARRVYITDAGARSVAEVDTKIPRLGEPHLAIGPDVPDLKQENQLSSQ